MIQSIPTSENWREWPTAAKQALLRRITQKIHSVEEAEEQKPEEWHLSNADPGYFIANHVQIFNATHKQWERFDLWPAQIGVLADMQIYAQIIVLKARQLGLTWLSLAFALWLILFRPATTLGIWSLRETDANDLLKRLKDMYGQLPEWARIGPLLIDNASHILFDNGSSARAFPTTGGRSYTFSDILIDEADLQPGLASLLNAVKPTVDAGGRLWMISTVDKGTPESSFKQIYRAAKAGEIEWHPIFLPWHARPDRTPEWYARLKAEDLATNSTTDNLWQEYPETDTQALAERTLDKRIWPEWIERCYFPMRPIRPADAPDLPGLLIWRTPIEGHRYVIGGDPAEGNPLSDDSALTVMNIETGEEMASLSGKFEPAILGGHADSLALYYNRAGILIERNNHGHAVILWLQQNSRMSVLNGMDKRPGWLSHALGKVLMYDALADAFRDQTVVLHTEKTRTQIASIEGATLRAPEGRMDDLADSFALANVARGANQGTGMRQGIVVGRKGSGNVRKSVRRKRG